MTTLKLSCIHVWNDLLMMASCRCRKPGREGWRQPVRHDFLTVLRWLRARKEGRPGGLFQFAVELSRTVAP